MLTISAAFLLLALLVFGIRRRHVGLGWAVIAYFGGLYADQTSWVGPHLRAIGAWSIRELSHIKL